MYKRLSLLFTTFFFAACSLADPVAVKPTTVPPTSAPAQATQAPAPTSAPVATSAAASATVQPSAAASQSTQAANGELLDDPALIAEAIPESRDQIALFETFKQTGDIPEVVRTEPLNVKVGDIETFWVSDVVDDTNYQIQAKLRYAGPVVLMYVDTTVERDISQRDIERSAKEFEERIYERNRSLFGEESSPGIDGDPRLTILNTPVRGAGGYFSSSDAVPKQVNRYSNERDMFVIGINSYPLGDDSYSSTLAHEFQHMIHAYQAERRQVWFNEGMSTLAEDLNGYVDHGTAYLHLDDPDTQLTTWASGSSQTGLHYGTSQLFMRYIYGQYGGDGVPAELIKADASNNLDAFVQIAQRKRPDITNFPDLFSDWAVANAVNDPDIADGRFAYELLPATVEPVEIEGSGSGTVSQFGADYLELPRGPATMMFDGSDAVSLTGVEPKAGEYAWWSNRGDDGVQTLTRAFDLSNVQQATLQFSLWHEIELDYDYGYVTVSTDGGETWATVKGNTTTDYDPQGANFGNGITGVSGSPETEPDTGVRGTWVEERMDLTPFAGKQILLRFWMINDPGVNASGMLIDNIRIPELNYTDGAEEGDGDWEAVGFVRTSGDLAQQWELRLVRQGNGSTTVEEITVDANNRARISLAQGERATLVVIGSSMFTTQKASYAYQVR